MYTFSSELSLNLLKELNTSLNQVSKCRCKFEKRVRNGCKMAARGGKAGKVTGAQEWGGVLGSGRTHSRATGIAAQRQTAHEPAAQSGEQGLPATRSVIGRPPLHCCLYLGSVPPPCIVYPVSPLRAPLLACLYSCVSNYWSLL